MSFRVRSASWATSAEDVRRLLRGPGAASGPSRRTCSPASACRCSTSSRPTTPSRSCSTSPASPPASLRILVKAVVVISSARKDRPSPACGHRRATTWSNATSAASPGPSASTPPSTRARAAPRWPTASCASSCRSSPSAAAAASLVPIDHGRRAVKLLFIGDIVGRPGRDLVRVGLPALVAPPRHRLRDRQRRERRRRHSASRATSASSSSPRASTSSPRAITSGTSARCSTTSARAAPAAAGQLPRRHAGPRRRAGARAGNGVRVGVAQRDGPRASWPTSTTRSRTAAREIARAARPRAPRSSSSTSTPRPRPRRSRWAGTSTARSPPSSARTRTCRPPTSACCRGGTAYLTDVGMTGPHDGVIGVEKARGHPAVPARGLPARFETATGDPRLHAVVVDADEATGRATAHRDA